MTGRGVVPSWGRMGVERIVAPSNEEYPRARPPAVLVVEDEALSRLAIAEHLRDCGYEVVEAGSADEAVVMLASGTVVDIVFSDVQTPGLMDGFELASWLHRQRPDVKVVLTSGYARAVDAADDMCRHAPLLAKPYTHEQVVHSIREILIAGAGASRHED